MSQPEGSRAGEDRRGPVLNESWIDRQIREAIERGEFDNLEGAGRPLRSLDDRDPDWWVKAKLEREGIAPPLPDSLQLRKEREEIQRTLADVQFEHQVREIVADLNSRIRESYRRRPDGPLRITHTLVADDVVGEWRERHQGR